MRFIIILLAIMTAMPAAAQTPAERTQLNWAVARGKLLFEVDRAAWVTTDDFEGLLLDEDRRQIRGWTVERDGNGFIVTYFAGEGASRSAIYRGRVENRVVVSHEVFSADARPVLTPMQRRLADAYTLVGRMNARSCGQSHPNLAVIPPDSLDAPIDIYVLTPQTEAHIFPFGGHTRATFSASGELLSQRAFTNTCIALSDRPPEGSSEVSALVITHLLDPIPTEIHVFMSIWMRMPVFVSTGDPMRVWEVNGDHISLVDTRRPPQPARPTT